jgi:hypothetical protein
MKIDKRGNYLAAWNSRVWNQEPIIILALDGIVMPSFAWVYSCDQFLRWVHVVAFYWG